MASLLRDIGAERTNKILIFVETKKKVDDIVKLVKREGFPAICIHGDKSQQERDYVLNEFRNGKCAVLVATDVAARGNLLNCFLMFMLLLALRLSIHFLF